MRKLICRLFGLLADAITRDLRDEERHQTMREIEADEINHEEEPRP